MRLLQLFHIQQETDSAILAKLTLYRSIIGKL